VTAALLRRIAAVAPTLVVVATLAFLLVHGLPGDAAAVMLGPEATPAQIEALRAELGADEPIGARFAAWLADVLRGDLGTSVHHGRPVTTLVGERVLPTLQLTVSALVVAVMVGLPAGVWASRRPGSRTDRGITLLATSATSIASFFLAMVLVLVFAVRLGWLPATGAVPLTEDLLAHLRHLMLPALALGLPLAGVPARVVRASLLDGIDADHLRAARARGVGPARLLLRHELRPSLAPTTALLGSSFADLLAGAVIVETVFNLPGMGQLVATSIGQRDLLVLQGVILFAAVANVLVSLAVDLVTSLLDPRGDHVRV